MKENWFHQKCGEEKDGNYVSPNGSNERFLAEKLRSGSNVSFCRINVADSVSEKRFSFDKAIENQSLQQNMTTPFFHISPPPKTKPPKRDPEERNVVVVGIEGKGGKFHGGWLRRPFGGDSLCARPIRGEREGGVAEVTSPEKYLFWYHSLGKRRLRLEEDATKSRSSSLAFPTIKGFRTADVFDLFSTCTFSAFFIVQKYTPHSAFPLSALVQKIFFIEMLVHVTNC